MKQDKKKLIIDDIEDKMSLMSLTYNAEPESTFAST